MVEQCCSADTAYLLLQLNVICLLLALIGSAAIVKHHSWFGAGDAPASQAIAQR
jgi:hypothetical protein